MKYGRNRLAYGVTTMMMMLSLTGCDGKAHRDTLIGSWATSQADCETEWLVLAEDGDARTVEFWRATDDATGPLPWRSGSWELRDRTMIVRFDHRIEHNRFLQTRINEAIDEMVQFEVRDISYDAFRLVATTGGFSPEALLLGGEEKLFVRCEK